MTGLTRGADRLQRQPVLYPISPHEGGQGGMGERKRGYLYQFDHGIVQAYGKC